MGLPRDDVVFRLWQCDKENHGWREGPPLTVPCQSFDLLGRAFTLATKSASNEKEYYLAPTGARSSIRTLAGLKRLTLKQSVSFEETLSDPAVRREVKID